MRAKVISKARSAARSSRRSGGKSSGVADAAAISVAGAGEGDPGGVDPGVACGVEAFDRILATVLDNKLLRFAAAVRAAGVWLGFGAQVTDIPHVEARVRKLAVFRANPAERSRGLASGDPWDVYVALCAQGMRDVLATIPEAQTLARDPSPGIRAAALRYAAATTLMSGQRVLAGRRLCWPQPVSRLPGR